MKPHEVNHQNINDVPEQVWQEVEAGKLPTDILKAEIERRGFIVKRPLSSPVNIPVFSYDEATGCMTDGKQYFDAESGNEITPAEAYERASGGW